MRIKKLNESAKKCCLCGKPILKFGNNPWPLGPKEDPSAECCDECNFKLVIPARLRKHGMN